MTGLYAAKFKRSKKPSENVKRKRSNSFYAYFETLIIIHTPWVLESVFFLSLEIPWEKRYSEYISYNTKPLEAIVCHSEKHPFTVIKMDNYNHTSMFF